MNDRLPSFHFFTGDVFVLGGGLLFIFDILHRIGTQYLVIHGKIKQPVQPTEATVALCGTEILVPYKKCLVTFAEVFRYIPQSNVLPT